VNAPAPTTPQWRCADCGEDVELTARRCSCGRPQHGIIANAVSQAGSAHIGGPLHVCTDCTPHHYDNCPDCFGLGVRPRSDGGFPVPISFNALRAGVGDDWRPCPTCGSTPEGVPKP